jgi:hypothetical protein
MSDVFWRVYFSTNLILNDEIEKKSFKKLNDKKNISDRWVNSSNL